MHYDSWDHDYCIDPDEWVCYGNCKDCPNLYECEDGRELLKTIKQAEERR